MFHIKIVYDRFCCYFFSTCQVDYQGDLVVYFTMLMLKNLIKIIIWFTNVKNITKYKELHLRVVKVDKQKEHDDITFQKLTTHAKIEVKETKINK